MFDERSRSDWRHRCRTAAWELLEQARRGGYFTSPDCRLHFLRDPQLEFLRKDEQFVHFQKCLMDEQL